MATPVSSVRGWMYSCVSGFGDENDEWGTLLLSLTLLSLSLSHTPTAIFWLIPKPLPPMMYTVERREAGRLAPVPKTGGGAES